MFGYVLPIKDKLKQQDFILYKSFYCGICKLTGVKYGQMPRFATNYDITFLSLFLHDINNQAVQFKVAPCISNPFAKRVTVDDNPLMEKLIATNIILSYYKLLDGIIDREGIKYKAMRRAFEKPYKQAKALLPEVDVAVAEGYAKLREMETLGSDKIDEVADCFALILKRLADILTGATDANIGNMCYNIGKFVYLSDALDDIDEDFKKGRYNVLLKAFGNYKNRKQFINDNLDDLKFCLNTTINRVIECFNNLRFSQSYDLMQNIVYYGLREKAAEIIGSDKKLKPPKL